MGLFDLFSAQPAQNAANAQTAGLTQGYNQYAGLNNSAIASLTGNYGAGSSALNSNYASAAVPYAQNLATGQQGVTAYGNAMGLNGPAGNAAATAAFWNNPAIQSQLDIGSQNVMRNQAATGQLNSGATNVDLQNLGQQVASQGWNNYVSNLSPYFNMAQGSAAGLAGVNTGLGSALASNYAGLGTGLAGLYGNQGQAAYGAQAGIGNANANAAMAPVNASANEWGVGLGLAGLAAGAMGAPGGGAMASKMGSSLFNQFGSQGGPTGWTGSDIRIKDDIMPVGKLFDGTNVYQFRYKGEPTTRIGLMAQEVEQRDPDAVREFGGIKMVDYKRATKPSADYASALMRIAA